MVGVVGYSEGFHGFICFAFSIVKLIKLFSIPSIRGIRGLQMKHNISITMDQQLFRELENIRGREKRSTFIQHLIVLGLKDFANTNQKKTVRTTESMATILPLTQVTLNHQPAES